MVGSVTARYLHDPVHPADVRTGGPGTAEGVREPAGWLTVSGLARHNLSDLRVRLPLRAFTTVTGVSGSGKTTLLHGIHDAVGEHLARVEDQPDPDDTDEETDRSATGAGERAGRATASGDARPTRLVRITQQPIGRTPRSNLATYTGLFDHVRKRFAQTPAARERGFTAGRFSFNTAAGRCGTCQGEGAVAVELLFLPGTYSACPACGGDRYTPETLEVTWQGRTIAQVLRLSVDEALPVFEDEPPVRRALVALQALGLGYLTLGQPATELSGGEAQRIKLATELQRERRSPTLYLFDEPTSGLHPADVHRLLATLHALVDAGHTVVVVEHDPVALATADWVLELGPGAGSDGGRVVASGPARG